MRWRTFVARIPHHVLESMCGSPHLRPLVPHFFSPQAKKKMKLLFRIFGFLFAVLVGKKQNSVIRSTRGYKERVGRTFFFSIFTHYLSILCPNFGLRRPSESPPGTPGGGEPGLRLVVRGRTTASGASRTTCWKKPKYNLAAMCGKLYSGVYTYTC